MAALLICRVNNVFCKPKKLLDTAFEGLFESEHKLKVIIAPRFLGAVLLLQISRFYLIIVNIFFCRK